MRRRARAGPLRRAGRRRRRSPDGRPSDGSSTMPPRACSEAIDSYDEARVHAVLDESLEALGLEAVLRGVILPALAEVGARLAAGPPGDQPRALRQQPDPRPAALAREALGPRARARSRCWPVPPGERHDITLIAFGLILRSHGWRILFLGADTPIETLERTVETARPDLTVLASFDPALLEAQGPALRRLARRGQAPAQRAGRDRGPLLAAADRSPGRGPRRRGRRDRAPPRGLSMMVAASAHDRPEAPSPSGPAHGLGAGRSHRTLPRHVPGAEGDPAREAALRAARGWRSHCSCS